MRNTSLFNLRRKWREYKGRRAEARQWAERQYAAPSLAHIKRAVLLRLGAPNAIWVETGTFMGDTAALLALEAREVYTIEPDRTLFEKAESRFFSNPSVHVIHGLSEEVFPTLLPTLSGTVNFWLDGHYSGGITHQGPTDCPVREELSNIEKNLARYANVTVLIDDIRCFDPTVPEYADYPDVNFLVDWARNNNLLWHIEHDIFVAKSNI
ncbi:MAG: hypothetical protein KKH12_08480 [Gammaproteobacteria bacterium]|nr:hypothetical protein [Gammaproteobacteria bacterium]MBU1481700.1 hypothetical protein [Gammaproteobacteria bacterium]